MANNLLIVESPAKARTIQKYLGEDFSILASYGHVRDLRPKGGAVEPDADFAMHYEVIEKNEKHVAAITRAMKKADALYLATDPDREGEAISWHLVELLRDRKALNAKPVRRVVFHEITPRAVQEAIEHCRELSLSLVNAQQARRALDYLVGFNLSPLLWKKIRRGLSAGRVQSPALRLIVEREAEIARFVKREYWTIEADLEANKRAFVARLIRYLGNKLEQFTLSSAGEAEQARATLLRAADGKLRVAKVEKKQRKRNPPAPFTTSTLQQEAARKLRFTAQRTMRVAQQLYEGIDTGGGAVGLISYMRTDSVSLARDAVVELRDFIGERFGGGKLPPKARIFKTKAKNAQEAHEAIRPTSITREPDNLRDHLTADQFRLYQLIWKRTLACQMIHATIDTVAVDFVCGEANTLRATGSTVVEPGFLAVYEEGVDDAPVEDAERSLPVLAVGDVVDLRSLRAEQHFTEPPPRYTEASLVKTLEEHGIGRPSTYASIIATLQQRDYVELESRRFVPTDVGRIVNNFLTEHFRDYVDYDFTARMEDSLDAISRGEKDWVPVMRAFWQQFRRQVEQKEATVSRKEAGQPRELGTDPDSGKPVSVRIGRYGPYVQIGSADAPDKPRFAGLRPGQRMDTITLEEALALFRLPRELGLTDDGQTVSSNVGRYGPYIRYGNKFASLGKEDDPYTVTLERALELISEKAQAEANRRIKAFPGTDIVILRGRYGPYITDGKRNAPIPKDRDPATLTVQECETIMTQTPVGRGRRRARKTG